MEYNIIVGDDEGNIRHRGRFNTDEGAPLPGQTVELLTKLLLRQNWSIDVKIKDF